MPWELVTLRDSGQSLAELRGLLLRYEWPQLSPTRPEPVAGKECGRILYAWSAAIDWVPAEAHQRPIERAAAQGGVAFDPARDVLPGASLGRLAAALDSTRREGPPIAVRHLLCHGGRAGASCGLSLDGEAPGDSAALVDAAQLRAALAPYADLVRLVVLMACDSGERPPLPVLAAASRRAAVGGDSLLSVGSRAHAPHRRDAKAGRDRPCRGPQAGGALK